MAYLVFAVLIAVTAAAALAHPSLRTFDSDVPDAEPDDLIGLAELRRRHAPDGRHTHAG